MNHSWPESSFGKSVNFLYPLNPLRSAELTSVHRLPIRGVCYTQPAIGQVTLVIWFLPPPLDSLTKTRCKTIMPNSNFLQAWIPLFTFKGVCFMSCTSSSNFPIDKNLLHMHPDCLYTAYPSPQRSGCPVLPNKHHIGTGSLVLTHRCGWPLAAPLKNFVVHHSCFTLCGC